MIGLISSDLIKPLPDVFGAVLRYDEARVVQRPHVVTQLRADLEGDDLSLGVQAIQHMLGDDAVPGSELDDGASGREVDTVNGRRAERGAAARKRPGGAEITEPLEEKGKGGQGWRWFDLGGKLSIVAGFLVGGRFFGGRHCFLSLTLHPAFPPE